MGVSTRKGDTGFTSTLGGERVSKDHLVTEAVGTVDEASSLLGLARASAQTPQIKRILLQVQKQLFTVGAEFSLAAAPTRKPRKTITEADVTWLDNLVEGMEEALALPPGFVAFGQEVTASQLDVARTAVRRVERVAVRLHGQGALGNPRVLEYLNRLSDLIFLLAIYEEKSESERHRAPLDHLPAGFWNRHGKALALAGGLLVAALATVIVLLLLFHGQPGGGAARDMDRHMQEMGHGR